MLFHEKLDFLMNITKTSNSLLAQNTFLDASHISRLRRGERKLVKDADYLKKMAAYFARQCVEEYQQKALLEVIQKPAALLQNPKNKTQLIYSWLLDDGSEDTAAVHGFLDDIANIQFKKPLNEASLPYPEANSNHCDVSLYYGNEGKRQAVLGFLSLVLESQQKSTLLLHSDESIDWLIEDLSFLAAWAEMLEKIIMQGNKIKIIHVVSRNLDEMLEGLTKWMPLYITGAIEPYYYPKKRDGVFQKTLFVAPGIAAVTSTSINIMGKKTVNILLKDMDAVSALTEEFNGYLNLCKPLMRIFTANDQLEYLTTLEEFEKEPADAIVKAGYLSMATMPASVAEAMINRSNDFIKQDLMDSFYKRKVGFEHNLQNNCFYEIIQLPDIAVVQAGKADVGFTGLQDSVKMFYNPEEYRAHLEKIIQLLLQFDNYQVHINKNIKDNEYRLYVKEDLGAIIIKATTPHAIFAINESNLTAAFWDYLSIIYKENKSEKQYVIRQLQKFIDELQ